MNLNLLTTISTIFKYIGYGAIAVLVLLLMITVHEFGHYVVGKIFKFDIEEFSIGFGPKLYSKEKKNGEIFSVRVLPLGGFCQFSGEDEENTNPNSFTNKKPYQRILVLIAGAFMNYILAVILIMAMFGVYGQNALKVDSLSPITEQENVFEIDDTIISINNKRVYLTTDLMKQLEGKKQGEEVSFTVLRNGKEKDITVTLANDGTFSNIEDNRSILIALGVQQMSSTSIHLGFFRTIGNSFQYSFRLGGTIFTVIHQLFNGKLGINSMGGTITTISVTTQAIMNGGLRYLLYIASFIGVNLAVFNLLPIPALDGSRVIFCLIEWITKKPVNRKIENIVHTVGFILLMCFAVFVDLQQCF
ncbi:MAG: site-2 protease family protein [Firmicutes bacterium]|nr:site-2 protease family protein [Candidatus Caballimonas caccae]